MTIFSLCSPDFPYIFGVFRLFSVFLTLPLLCHSSYTFTFILHQFGGLHKLWDTPFISSKPSIVCLLCPPPCEPFSIQESAVGGLSYKVKKNVPWHIHAPRHGCFGNHLPLRRVRILAERFYRMETKFPIR